MPFTNYEILKKTGQLNPYCFVVDTTKIGIDGKMTIGEYLNLPVPKYWTKAEKERYYQNRFKKILSYAECDRTSKERSHKYNMKVRIKKRVDLMSCPYYYTQTFDNKNLAIDTIRKLKKLLNNLHIKYCLITDYGSENARFHVHGYIDLIKYDQYFSCSRELNNEYFQYFITKKKVLYFIFKPLINLGFNTVSKPVDLTRNINYIMKYITKDLKIQGCEHKMIASRLTQTEKNLKNQKIIDNLKEKFGIIVNVE